MPGTITPLPIMVEEEEQRRSAPPPEPPKTLVVRYGSQAMIGEFPYDGEIQLGCGTKLVVRTHRGIEMGEMLTSTCPNAGCGSSVTRKEMLQYIEKSGGKDYPFSTRGKVLRAATAEDVSEQSLLDSQKPKMRAFAVGLINEMDLPMKLIDIELLLGGERILFHYASEQWVDFRELVRNLASEYQTRIEMHQVNAREEARLTADYERCGQHCCCKQFLKVLKPVSMRSAKVQKGTVDPSKISGRCGRLMCCLRYEDQTYASLRKNLPSRQSRVLTEDGMGTVIDTQVLTQLVLVRLDDVGKTAAYAVENIEVLTKEREQQLQAEAEARAAEQKAAMEAERKQRQTRRPKPPEPRKPSPPTAKTGASGYTRRDQPQAGPPDAGAEPGGDDAAPKRKRRRKRRRGGRGRNRPGGDGPDAGPN